MPMKQEEGNFIILSWILLGIVRDQKIKIMLLKQCNIYAFLYILKSTNVEHDRKILLLTCTTTRVSTDKNIRTINQDLDTQVHRNK